jgi:hypothetical protein
LLMLLPFLPARRLDLIFTGGSYGDCGVLRGSGVSPANRQFFNS